MDTFATYAEYGNSATGNGLVDLFGGEKYIQVLFESEQADVRYAMRKAVGVRPKRKKARRA